MLKPISKILEPDPRHASEVMFYPATGLSRPAKAADLHALVVGIEVSTAAPAFSLGTICATMIFVIASNRPDRGVVLYGPPHRTTRCPGGDG